MKKVFHSGLCVLLCVSQGVYAQESANADLDACVKKEQISQTAKGAAAGALAGLGKSLLSGKKDENVGKNMLVGAAVGGAAGFAMAYFQAVDKCYKKNPNWIPESKIVRSKDYQQVKQDTHYSPSEGLKVKATHLQMPKTAKAGATIDLVSTFTMLTPDGAEAMVNIERKLFVIEENGTRTALPTYPGGKSSEQRTLEPGEHQDSGKLTIPHDTKAGVKYEFDFGVSINGQTPSTITETVLVQ